MLERERSRSFEELQQMLAGAVRDLAEPDVGDFAIQPRRSEAQLQGIVNALRATISVLSASLGECRRAVPYSPMHPVNEPDGVFHWCCNHDPEHCGR